MRLTTCLLVLAACGSPQSSPSIASHADQPVAPTTAAPSVKWIDNGFDADLLPAVASDGSFVVLALRENDGGRGMPNLKLVVKDRKDAVTKTVLVLDADEAESLFAEDGSHPKVDERIAAANTWLAELHRKANLVPLTKLEPQKDPEGGYRETHRATGGDLAVDWKSSKLSITRAGRSLVDRATPETWLASKRPACATCDVCENPELLGGAAIDASRTIAVITVSYTGNDTCWEPSDQQRVVVW
jgi:hypothetical protein